VRDFFVWSTPSSIDVIEAASEQDAAEAFLEEPVTSAPIRGIPPACFVQPTVGLEIPQVDGASVEFWVSDG